MTCHYIKTDRDGTSWCGLAEQNGHENSELRARIAALSAPPTKAEIESVAIVLAGMYGTFHTPLDYSDDKNAAKAAIETLLKGRGV